MKTIAEHVCAQTALSPGCGHLLVVDDNEFNRFLLTQLLQKHGFVCQTVRSSSHMQALNGREAVDLVAAHGTCQCKGFKLVLMDLDMPEMTGLEATREIRKFNSSMPIIAVTAFNTRSDIEICLRSGMNDHGTLLAHRQSVSPSRSTPSSVLS